ncbi:MAG TPA: DUF4403 family protein, partial [bacterium]|nr:DUF4403 family protein [bacterium]
MDPRRLFPALACLSALAFGLGGCSSIRTNLYIPPSEEAARPFPDPPPAVIRLPVSVPMPQLAAIPKNTLRWVEDQLAGIGENAQKQEGLVRLPGPLLGVDRLWNALQEPIYIDKNIWLLIRPESLSSGLEQPERLDPFTWKVVLEMTARPLLIFGGKPEWRKKNLPPLKPYKPGPTGFHAVSNAFISFKEANRILADPKTGLVDYPIRGSGSYHLRVKGVRLYGSGGQVIAQTRIEYHPLINFDGKPSRMTIYFRGTPRYDPKREVFYLHRLDFDVRTGDLLMQVASWIFKSDILNALRRKAHIPIGSELDKLKERMNVVLNRPVGEHHLLRTQVQSFRVLDARVHPEGIEA